MLTALSPSTKEQCFQLASESHFYLLAFKLILVWTYPRQVVSGFQEPNYDQCPSHSSQEAVNRRFDMSTKYSILSCLEMDIGPLVLWCTFLSMCAANSHLEAHDCW